MTAETLNLVLSYAALGLIVGFGYYMTLGIGQQLAKAPRWLVVAAQVARIGAAIVFFMWLAQLGLTPILSAFAGFLIGRLIAFQLLGVDP